MADCLNLKDEKMFTSAETNEGSLTWLNMDPGMANAHISLM